MSLLRFAIITMFALALLCLVVPTTILDSGWPTWTVAGLLAWALEGQSFNITFGRKR